MVPSAHCAMSNYPATGRRLTAAEHVAVALDLVRADDIRDRDHIGLDGAVVAEKVLLWR